MTALLLASVAMCIVLALLAWGSYKYAAFWHKVLVNDHFAAVNEIVMTEDVPAAWRLKVVERLIGRNPGAPFWRKVNALLYRWYIYRLDRLVREVRISSVIRKQDKLEFIQSLGDIRAEWLSRTA